MFLWPKRVAETLNLVLFVHSMLLTAASAADELGSTKLVVI